MAPPFPEAKITLDYPLYACDFDPHDANRLFVGGGGGSSRTGVGNKITSLDVSTRDAIETVGEIVLSKNEDNVTTLAAGQHLKGKATLLYAGISSGDDDLKKGTNEHFRVFAADQPSAKSKSGVLGARIAALNKSSLFTTQSTDTYQRLLRLTQAFPGGASQQFGAVATGFANEPQIALFDVAAGNNVAPRPRGVLDLKKEAVDMDVIQTAEATSQLLYCDEYNLYTLDVPNNKSTTLNSEPKTIFTIPPGDIRPSLRCVRYLSPNFAFAVANLPRPGGVVLYGFRLPKAGKATTPTTTTTARIAVNAKLPKRQGAKATGLAIANLSPVASAGAKQGDAQFVIAVANNDFSIHLYTLDHKVMGDVDLLANLYPLRVLTQVHPAMITNLAFSHFVPPKSGTGRTQHLKLASTSVSNSVVVHSIALKKHFDKAPAAKARRGGPPRQPRYVTALDSRAPSPTALLVGFALAALLFAVLFQGILEVKGYATPVVGGHRWLPSSIHSVPSSPVAPHSGFLAKLLEERDLARTEGLVLLDSGTEDGITTTTQQQHDGSARSWEELGDEQKELWKARLKKGGHWMENHGETIFKGILFGEIGAGVAAIMGG